ncbi:MAG: hypothetical protein ACP5QO_09710 [Clostridia bacterium]
MVEWECRRHAPVVVVLGEQAQTMYPRVHPQDRSCGDLQLSEAAMRRALTGHDGPGAPGAAPAMEYRSGKGWRKGLTGGWPPPPVVPGRHR